MATDFCPYCGEWGCGEECSYDDYAPDQSCRFCGEYECDGSGYNCPDGVYATYNEGHIDVEVT